MGCQITGSLPSEYEDWGASISVVILASNQLNGTLPEEYAAWTNLGTFAIYNNCLVGSLPSEYALNGTLPHEYQSWTSLLTFQASTNAAQRWCILL